MKRKKACAYICLIYSNNRLGWTKEHIIKGKLNINPKKVNEIQNKMARQGGHANA